MLEGEFTMSNNPIGQDKPEKILLTSDSVTNITKEYSDWYEPDQKRIKYKELTITLTSNILLNLFALLLSFSSMPLYAKIIAGIILGGISIYAIVCLTRWLDAYNKVKNKTPVSLTDMLIEKAKENIKYTAIARITYKDKSEMKYLLGEDFFLPHCTMDKALTIYDQEKNIQQSLFDDFGIRETGIIRISPVDEKIYYSIKPVHGSVHMNAFVFFDVTIQEQLKEKLLESNNGKRRWLSIENMKKSTTAMATNKDVIEFLETLPKPKECFENILGNIKIIWNITSKCPYNCAICATHDEKREELDLEGKLQVLNSISTANHMIKSVDFAGGDPLQFDGSSTFIKSATAQLGAGKVSITTTGKGLSKLTDDEFINAIKHFELTIDASHAVLGTERLGAVSRNEENYFNDNIENISLISGHSDSLTINIPIINDDLTEQEIENLISRILQIKNRMSGIDIDASLIRLMPVGKMHTVISKKEYEKYNPISVAKNIKSKLEGQGIPCKLHCSLRVLPDFYDGPRCKEHCNMLESKLGIDCAGNVFACAWGAYLQSNDPPTKNPFYLGNLTRVPLIKILTGASKTKCYTEIFNQIENKNHRQFCSVISYYQKKTLFTNNDPLSNKTIDSSSKKQ